MAASEGGGYVKSLAKQLSCDNNSGQRNNKTSPPCSLRHDNNGFSSKSPSPSSTASTSSDEALSPGIPPNIVQSLVKAAEKQKNDAHTTLTHTHSHTTNSTTTSPLFNKRPSLPNNTHTSLDPNPKCNGSGFAKCFRKFSSPENSKTYSNKPPPKPNYLGQLSPKTSPCRNRKFSPNGQSNSNGNSDSNSPSSPSPTTVSRKPSHTNGPKPSIPQKPTSLSNPSPRKPSIPSKSNSNNPTASPLPKPNNTPSKFPVNNNNNNNNTNNNDEDQSVIYAQVNKITKSNKHKSPTKTKTKSNETHSCDESNNSKSTDKSNNSNASTTCNVVLRTGEGGRTRRDSEQYRDSVFNTIYDNAAALSAAELFDSSWSDSDSYKDFSDDDDDDDDDDVVDGGGSKKKKKKKKREDDESSVETAKGDAATHEDKRCKVAGELLKTEQDYVAMLHLLHEVFYKRLSEENSQQQLFPSEVLKRIFANTKSIYLFHNDFLLPQLQDRMKNWDKDARIGDLMKKNAPFLMLYSEYINNFSHAMKVLKDWMEKSTRFSAIIQELQKDPKCGHLSLQHHMLGPIQRVPRYELLLKDYVKHLPADSPDMNDAKDALDLVTRAACHSNEAIAKIETFRKLLDIYQNLRGVAMDFISPTREFVMQGPVTKISARSGEKQPRYIFLFNDMVLICSQYLLGTYNVRSELQVDNMEIKPGTNMNIPSTFMVHSKQKVVELLDETNSPERLDWEQKIKGVIETYKIKKRSIKQDNIIDYPHDNMVPDSCLGKTAPEWIPDDAATMCMLCGASFNIMMRRRHHCRSCGKLVCKSCCNKAPLEYKQGKIERVCSYCYDVIVNKVCDSSPDTPVKAFPNGNSPKKKGSTKKVKASDPGLIGSYLQCSDDNGKTWQRLWVVAHTDFVLYTFKAHEDVNTVSILPLPGHHVELHTQHAQHGKAFCIRHKKKCLLYQPDNDKKTARWVAILGKLVKAELPDESLRLSTQSDVSNNSSSSDTCAVVMTTTTTTTMQTGSDDGANGHLDCEDPNDDKADARSQYDNVDP